MRLIVRGQRLRHVRRGVTLTEVVIASALLAVAVVPVLRALTSAQAMGTVVERKTQSVILAQGTLDEIRASAFHQYDTAFGKNSEPLVGAYLCTVTDNQHPDLRLITVAVGFDVNSDGYLAEDEVDVILATYIAKR